MTENPPKFPRARRHRRLLLEALEPRTLLTGTWTPLAHAAPSGLNSAVLLTNGQVLFQIAGTSNRWATLTPTSTGSYINGTWANVASSTLTRLDDSTQVLQNGNVYVAGGEYGTGGFSSEIYNPFTNSWTAGPTTSLGTIDDAESMLLPNGNVLQYVVGGTTSLIYNVSANTYSSAIPIVSGRNLDEQTWVKLPDGSILATDGEFADTNTSERFIPSQNQWINDAVYPNAMIDNLGEQGPAFLLPDGRAFFLGANGSTNFYTPSGSITPGTWTAGPTIPNGLGIDDGNGAELADGTIFFTAGTPNTFNGPVSVFIFDPLAGTYTTVPNVPAPIANAAPYYEYMIELPDGTILMTDGSGNAFDYNPNVTPVAAAVPVITSITPTAGGSYTLAGTGLNGLDQGAVYGDDNQMDTNYPIVRLTLGSNVYYATTTNWSTTGVQTGSTPETVTFTLPSGIPNGTFNVVSIANGIPSAPVSLLINNTRPTIAAAASAMPTPITGTTTALSVLGANPNGESSLIYTWSVASKPPNAAAPTFSINGTNDAKNTLATFSAAGTYVFTATITEAPGLTITSNVTVTVNPIFTSFGITPTATTVILYNTQQLTAAALDQFANPMPTQPTFTWTDTGVGSVSPAGLFSASSQGTANIIATTGTTVLQTSLSVLAPLVWLRNDSITGSTTAIDSSGNNFNGTINGTFGSTYNSTPGQINSALNLSSTTNSTGYVTIGSGFSTALHSVTNFTVMAWVNLTTINDWARLFDFNGGNTTRYMFLTPADGSGLPRFAITTSGGAGEKVVQGTTAIATGSWHFLAFTLAGSTGTIYLDGVSIGSATGINLNPNLLGLTSKDYLGKSAFNDPNLVGSIDDFRLYGGAASAAAIANMYTLGLSASNHMPTLATAASATPVSGNAATLSTLGAESAGESNLMYVWSVTGTPPGNINFSANGTNAAKNTTVTFSKVGTYNFLVTIADPLGYTTTSTTNIIARSTVVGRYAFYGNSAFDTTDDNAIAPDKSALLPGQTASFANYTSYVNGINGVMIDIAGTISGTFSASDFLFNVGNDNNPGNWPGAPAPVSVITRPGAGVNGSTRIEILWNNNAIQNQWLQVTLKADSASGLASPDVFYFGNAIGESGDSPIDTLVNATDQLAPRFAPSAAAPITDPFDYNRDGIVDNNDEIIARNNYTYFLNALQLITPPAPPPVPSETSVASLQQPTLMAGALFTESTTSLIKQPPPPAPVSRPELSSTFGNPRILKPISLVIIKSPAADAKVHPAVIRTAPPFLFGLGSPPHAMMDDLVAWRMLKI